MTKLVSRQAALAEPAFISGADFAELESRVGRAFEPALRTEIDAACNAFHEHKA